LKKYIGILREIRMLEKQLSHLRFWAVWLLALLWVLRWW